MPKQEGESRIPDIDKAWTAANAEDMFREMAEKKFGKNTSSVVKSVIDRGAEEAGEKRIQNYNPDEEMHWDDLRARSEQLIHKCEFHLQKEFGSIEEAVRSISDQKDTGDAQQDLINLGYKVLYKSIDDLKSTIKNIKLDKGQSAVELGADFLAPEARIKEWEEKIMKILNWIDESKQILQEREQRR